MASLDRSLRWLLWGGGIWADIGTARSHPFQEQQALLTGKCCAWNTQSSVVEMPTYKHS